MITNSVLNQLMGLRMNGIMSEITNNDLDYQEIIRKSDVYFDELAALQLPEETRLHYRVDSGLSPARNVRRKAHDKK